MLPGCDALAALRWTEIFGGATAQDTISQSIGDDSLQQKGPRRGSTCVLAEEVAEASNIYVRTDVYVCARRPTFETQSVGPGLDNSS